MNRPIQAAIYARVSSEQQAETHTIESQVAALRACVTGAGLELPGERQFLDDGHSGATLVRPALEQLRDLVAAGGVDQLYVAAPDRLARKYAYQVLLLEEFQRAGVEVIFLNRPRPSSPEEELLLQVQGMVAEYERAQILERSRRGKRYAAKSGQVSVLSGAPYGYRYVSKQEGGGTARFDIVPEEASIVRQIFTWMGRNRLSIAEVTRRLNEAGVRTRTQQSRWDRGTVWAMLKNPTYQGSAAFGKTRNGPWQPRLRPARGQKELPRHPVTATAVPKEEWILIPVPPLVDAALFAAVQEQLQENQRHARQHPRGVRYLLQGLVTCRVCGYGYYGTRVSEGQDREPPRHYGYYRCYGTNSHRFGGERVCDNRSVRVEPLDTAVWEEVRRLLEEPYRLEEEYRRRGQGPPQGPSETERSRLETRLKQRRVGLARLIDSYAEGLIDKEEFAPRLQRQREQIAQLEEQVRQWTELTTQQAELRLVLGRLEEFAAKVQQGLAAADWETRREMIRTLVKRVEVDREQVEVVFRVPPDPFESRPERGVLQHCHTRASAALPLWRSARA